MHMWSPSYVEPNPGRSKEKKVVIMEEAAAKDIDIQKQQFDSSKGGVKGLVDSGIQQVPNIFIQPEHRRPQPSLPFIDAQQIPMVDLQGIHEGHCRPHIVQQIAHACKTWGFFQVVNHAVPVSLMERMIEAAKRFNEEPMEQKLKYYSHDFDAVIKYAPSFNLHKQETVDWKDGMRITYAPRSPDYSNWPPSLREESMEYCEHIRVLGATVLNLLSEALSLSPNYLTETINCVGRQNMMINFYPPCPQPDLTLGTSIHSDAGSITILLMDHVGGLQVKNNGNWFAVAPIHGAFVINIGDQLEILSNGIFKSVEHCAVTNSVDGRVSIAMFFSPLLERGVKIGPILDLMNASNPPNYREIGFKEYMRHYLDTVDHSKSCLDIVRLSPSPFPSLE
eukprot:Gb_25256 [translate_table: standard]